VEVIASAYIVIPALRLVMAAAWRSVLIHIQPLPVFSVQGTNSDWLWRTNCAELRLLPYDHGVAPGTDQEATITGHHDWRWCLVGFRCDCAGWGTHWQSAVVGAGAVVTTTCRWRSLLSACPCYQHAQQPSLKVNLSVLKQRERTLSWLVVWLSLNSRIVLNLN